MNPFDLPGPQFLLFYFVLSAVVLTTLGLTRRAVESSKTPPFDVGLSDPYLIAYLRGGKNEALRVATVSLIDRGFFEVKDTEIVTKKKTDVELVKRPIEKKLLEKFRTKKEASSIFDDPSLEASCQNVSGPTKPTGAFAG